MPNGQLAWIFALGGTVIVALIGAWATRRGALITRGTELTKVYMARLQATEDENDALHVTVHTLREQHIVDMTALAKLEGLEREIADLKARLAQRWQP